MTIYDEAGEIDEARYRAGWLSLMFRAAERSLWGGGTSEGMRGLATLFNEPEPRALLHRRLSEMAGLDENGRVRAPSVALMGGVGYGRA